MRPKEIVHKWVEAFNRGDADEISAFYDENAVNHQVANAKVEGKEAIRQMFEQEFSNAEMVCIVERVYEDGEWAILEWKDPIGLRGCGFFHIQHNLIQFQRGYWDKLSFLRAHNLPVE
ncbi:nuclear transport factor 2 family protein [Thalassotalea agarivorans]|uniref:SnoaL-like domain-containing protein n=1 Tax=Thalassotalea agarivorans TaxID=349064 RepID=A0A1I0BLF1_THASX|nr:nuclear transport factor 2 family protein [Thalassotalea agarivorans]SET07776.1 SnoaL-like domain-containing protein [Thalassotalea agarivorans]